MVIKVIWLGNRWLGWLLSVWLAIPAYGQSGEQTAWQAVTDSLNRYKNQPAGQLLIRTGEQLLGIPYEARTLDRDSTEQLIVYLNGLDCTTFVENTLAITQTARQPEPSFPAFTNALQRIRYRNGEISGYPSRLHYFSEWLHNNQQKGILTDITAEIGGKPYPKTLNFMSTHRKAYPALASNVVYRQIIQTEKQLNQHKRTYIPKTDVRRLESQLRDGDIIAITTPIVGLDVVHVGFAVRRNGRVHLLHASTDEKKVVVSQQPLAEYLLTHKNQSGIMVARVK